jgi:VanZ family protein
VDKQPNWRAITWGLAALVWMGLIFGLSAQNGDESGGLSAWAAGLIREFTGIPITEHLTRKLAHATEYAILAVLVSGFLHSIRAVRNPADSTRDSSVDPATRAPAWPRWAFVAITVAIVFGYACTDEFHQLFSPGRGALFTDVLIDTAGGLVGSVIASVAWRSSQ